MADPDVLYDLLPEGGEQLSFAAAQAAFEEQTGKEISDNQLHQLIFALHLRVTWQQSEGTLGGCKNI